MLEKINKINDYLKLAQKGDFYQCVNVINSIIEFFDVYPSYPKD